MKESLVKHLLPLLLVLVLLGTLLYFLNPYAPLFLLASIIIQAPIVWGIMTYSFRTSYRQRSDTRLEKFEKDNDAYSWLHEEMKEYRSIGRKYWSKAGNTLSLLNRIEASLALDKTEEAMELWAEVESKNVAREDRKRYENLQEKIGKYK